MNLDKLRAEIRNLIELEIQKVPFEETNKVLEDWGNLKGEIERLIKNSEKSIALYKKDGFSTLQVEEEGFLRGVKYVLEEIIEFEKYRHEEEEDGQ